jgi:hypothetical protein
MIWQGIDKRRFPRAEYPCKVIVLRSDLRETFSTHTENIGTGGICVILGKELPRFCPVEVLLYLKDKGGPVECNGRVVWMVQEGGSFDVGIEFIDIKETDRLRIGKVVQECLRGQT